MGSSFLDGYVRFRGRSTWRVGLRLARAKTQEMIASLWLMPAGRADEQTSDSLFFVVPTNRCATINAGGDGGYSLDAEACIGLSLLRFNIPRIPSVLLRVFLFNVAFGLSSVGYIVNGPVWCHGCYNVARLSPRAYLAFQSAKVNSLKQLSEQNVIHERWTVESF